MPFSFLLVLLAADPIGISLAPLQGSTEQIEITDVHWSGTDHGHGRLRSCLVEARSQTGVHRFLLPGPEGTPAPASAGQDAVPTPGADAEPDVGRGPEQRPVIRSVS